MANAQFNEITSALQSAHRILITSHTRPDADALGSILAFAIHLTHLGKDVSCWNEDGIPSKFHYLPEFQKIQKPPPEPQKFDAVLALDCSTYNRLGSVINAIQFPTLLINIDHHVSNEHYGQINLIDPTAPATGQIIYEYFTSIGASLTNGIAENLFAAISTDTGSFQYRGTNHRTFQSAAGLAATGIDIAEISRKIYQQPRRRLNLLKHALNSATFSCNDQLVSFAISLDEIHSLGLEPDDFDGIMDCFREVQGVICTVLYEELTEGKIRVSARSNHHSLDVCKICASFGGGGHPLAAGARIPGTLQSVVQSFNNSICHAIKSRN